MRDGPNAFIPAELSQDGLNTIFPHDRPRRGCTSPPSPVSVSQLQVLPGFLNTRSNSHVPFILSEHTPNYRFIWTGHKKCSPRFDGESWHEPFRKATPNYARCYASGLLHRFAAAFLAISARRSGVMFSARFLPPFAPSASQQGLCRRQSRRRLPRQWQCA